MMFFQMFIPMKKNYLKIVMSSFLITVVGVFVIDYFSHLVFSDPMETMPYFITKAALYFVFSILFLYFVDLKKKRFLKVFIAGIVVSLMWGFYYNMLPAVMDSVFDIDFYPFGIALNGLTFLGMGLFGTGFAFGVVHTAAFIGGYYAAVLIEHLGQLKPKL